MLRNWQVSPVLDSYQQMINHPLEACRALLSMDPERNGIMAAPQAPQQGRHSNLHPSSHRNNPSNSKLRSRKLLQQKETMASTDDKPALKITLEDLASVELPAAAPAGNMAPIAAGTKQYGNIAAPADGPAIVTEEKGSIFLQGWFYLGLAGVVGALVGWGICEPFFVDAHTEMRWGNIAYSPLCRHVYLSGPGSG